MTRRPEDERETANQLVARCGQEHARFARLRCSFLGHALLPKRWQLVVIALGHDGLITDEELRGQLRRHGGTWEQRLL